MKFSEFLTLKEEEGGGGEATPAVDNGDTGDAGETGESGESSEDDATPGTAEIAQYAGNSTANIAGWSAPFGLYTRITMPQITREMYSEFINDLNLHNIKHKKCNVKACKLTPTQNEFNQDKIKNIQASIKDGTYKHEALLVAGKDYSIADGHHRWAAFKPNDDIQIHKVDLSFNDLYNFLDNKPYVVKRGIKQ